MDSSAQKSLSTTIRALRTRLLDDLHNATETEYRLSLRPQDAGLNERARARRRRFEALIDEQLRAQKLATTTAKGKGKTKASSTPIRSKDDFRRDAEKQAAYTLLNRLVLLRLMEEPGHSGKAIRPVAIVTGGWESRGYKDFRELAPALVRGDDSEGYALLLKLTFEDLATDLPGLYGPMGAVDLVAIPTATLRHVIDALNAPELATCWSDDMTLGWVYQYWNDPEREELDAKINAGEKIEPHEIASKTQLFTERYMVDWLLQNSLGPMWLAMCQKQGWKPDVVSTGTLSTLETRRAEWRAKREANEVELTELMPLYSEDERRWAYYLPQPISDAAVESAPESIRDLKLIDPAVGSGHFLVVATDLLFALYQEEARHRGEASAEMWTDRAIVERILGHNLHGVDLDPRAVQIAAAALWLKAQSLAPGAHPERLNLVASNLNLSSLPDNDPALVELRNEIERETGIPASLTDTLLHALRGADHLGSLLKVDQAVEDALNRHETLLGRVEPEQGGLFTGYAKNRKRKTIGRDEAKATLLDRLEAFMAKHAGGEDVGLRLRGEQLAAGVRFVRIVRENTYDLVVANPPYQGTSKMAESQYLEKTYPLGKSDLYAAFLLRGLELARTGGVSAMLAMRNWMFIKQYADLRKHLLANHGLQALGDFDRGAFAEIAAGPGGVSVAVSVFQRDATTNTSVVIRPSPINSVAHDLPEKRAATLCQTTLHTFSPDALKVVPEWPLVYWWDEEMLRAYEDNPLIKTICKTRRGATTGNNSRFLRRVFEINRPESQYAKYNKPIEHIKLSGDWVPYIKGAAGRAWVENLSDLIRWTNSRLELATSIEHNFGDGAIQWKICNNPWNSSQSIAYSTIGSRFTARKHRYHSVVDVSGASLVPHPSIDLDDLLCSLNKSESSKTASSLNPSVNYQLSDIQRLPFFKTPLSSSITATVDHAFLVHESHREPSVEFLNPGPSPWRHAQEWAQLAVDRPSGAALPEYAEELDPEPATDHLSFALGVALGRFGLVGSEQEGTLDPSTADLTHALAHGILFLDTTLADTDHRDGLGDPAAAPLHAAWAAYGPAIGTKRSLREWLALDFFKGVHLPMYENRPIHWPLSSANKSFVAWVNIHRFTDQTLRVLLADHLKPTLVRLDGELADIRAARDSGDKKAARDAERQLDRSLKAKDELEAFIAAVEQCADHGAPPTDSKCPKREQDARYAPNLDDGVMVNAAALWPLLESQWKEPKKWWKELASSVGKKDYDWSRLAMRYWPTRVDQKCQEDPSLGVAHGCFWRYHPAKAWAWELRLQDEIGPDFRIEEPPYQPGGRDLGDGGDRAHRDAWLANHAVEALAAIEKEAERRMGRGKSKRLVTEMTLLETGIWSAHAEQIWDMELRLSEKLGVEFRILAPDEAEARAHFAAENPHKVWARKSLLENLVPTLNLLADEEDEEFADGYDDSEEDDA